MDFYESQAGPESYQQVKREFFSVVFWREPISKEPYRKSYLRRYGHTAGKKIQHNSYGFERIEMSFYGVYPMGS